MPRDELHADGQAVIGPVERKASAGSPVMFPNAVNATLATTSNTG